MSRRTPRWLVAALAAWALGPIGVLVLRSASRAWLFPRIWPDWESAAAIVPASASLAGPLTTTVAIAGMTGVVSTLVAFAGAYAMARSPRGLRSLVAMGAFFTVVAPPVALSVGLQVALLSVGLGGTVVGVTLAHLVPATGYVTLLALGVVGGMDWVFEDEARTLGASPWQVMRRVTIPILRGPLVEGMVLGSLVSWGQVATTLLVGGGLVRTLPVDLLSFVQAGNDQLATLAALALSLPPLCAIGILQVGASRTGATP